MGQALAGIAAAAFEVFSILNLAVVAILYAILIGPALLFTKRDGDVGEPISQHLFFRMKGLDPQDAQYMSKQNTSVVDWNHVTGLVHANWTVDPPEDEGPNIVYGFYPRCAGFENGQVIDDQGNHFVLDYWTPNGTAKVWAPKNGWQQTQWLMEISEDHVWDCRDRYNELPANITRPKPKTLTPEQELEITKAKELKLLQECDPETLRKHNRGELTIDCDLANKADYTVNHFDCPPSALGPNVFLDFERDADAQARNMAKCLAESQGFDTHDWPKTDDWIKRRGLSVVDHFSRLPTSEDSLSKYATDGAEMIMQTLGAKDVSGKDQARILHKAMSSILGAHRQEQQKRSLWRLFRREQSAAVEEVVDATVSAVIDAAEVREKKWMQMLAVGAVVRSVREAMQDATAGDAEGKTMVKMFERFA